MRRELSPQQTAGLLRQIGRSLPHSAAWRALPRIERERIRGATEQIAALLGQGEDSGDPYALALEDAPLPVDPTVSEINRRKGDQRIQSGLVGSTTQAAAPQGGATNANQAAFNAEAAMAGTRAAGNLIREVNFTAFVAELVQGVFKAIVQSSMDQMKAYAELVQSVVGSTNEFRDQNVDDSQAADHLQSRYPNIFQVSVGGDGQRKVTPRKQDFDSGELPSFAELGFGEPLTSLDQEFVDEKLIPAAKQDLSSSRQRMLATMVLMGINRIIVTDGRINAKVRFDFTAKDSVQRKAMAMDYANLGTTVVETEGGTTTNDAVPPDAEGKGGLAKSITTGAYAYVEKPEIKLTGMSQTTSQGELQSQAMMMGEVAINFRSETFPLEKMVDSGQMNRLQDLQAGRGTPPPLGPGQPPGSAALPAAAAPPSGTPNAAPAGA